MRRIRYGCSHCKGMQDFDECFYCWDLSKRTQISVIPKQRICLDEVFILYVEVESNE